MQTHESAYVKDTHRSFCGTHQLYNAQEEWDKNQGKTEQSPDIPDGACSRKENGGVEGFRVFGFDPGK